MTRFVIALGGNQLSDPTIKGEPYENQLDKITQTAKVLASLIAEGHKLVITHGNGPQVGSLLLQQQADVEGSTNLPLKILGALTQGQIGVSIQHAIINELRALNIKKNVYVIPTSVIVDKEDPGFKDPSKPVGPFFTEEEFSKINKNYSFIIKSEGYRRVVPSPKPMAILEVDLIKDLMEKDDIVIAVGGGGSPTLDNGKLEIVDAVIDKDLASAVLAKKIGADMLIILTNVDGVYSNFGTEDQKLISNLRLEDVTEMLKTQNGSMKGSMAPKLEACVSFADKGASIITSPEYLLEAIQGKAGTRISN